MHILFRTLLCSILIMSSVSVAQASFSDIPETDEYYESIDSLSDKGIITGNPDGSFSPQRILNRAELTAIVLRAAGITPEANDKNCFPDVQEEWFAGVVCAAKRLNILSGYQDGTFGPGNQVTAGQAAKIMANALQGQNFQDLSQALEYVEARRLFRQRYTNNQLLKRNEAAERIHRMILYPGDDHVDLDRRDDQVDSDGNPFDPEEDPVEDNSLTRENLTGNPTYTAATQQQVEQQKGEGPAILFFHAPWCPLCKRSDGVISEALDSLKGEVSILKVDYDTNLDLRAEYKVTYQDAFIVLDASGNEVGRKSGIKSAEEIQELLFQALNL